MSDRELQDKEIVHRISSLYSNLECITIRYTKEDPKTNPDAKKQPPKNQSTFRNKPKQSNSYKRSYQSIRTPKIGPES